MLDLIQATATQVASGLIPEMMAFRRENRLAETLGALALALPKTALRNPSGTGAGAGYNDVILGPFLTLFPALNHPARTVHYALLLAHAPLVLTGACNAMVCLVRVFRPGSGLGHLVQRGHLAIFDPELRGSVTLLRHCYVTALSVLYRP